MTSSTWMNPPRLYDVTLHPAATAPGVSRRSSTAWLPPHVGMSPTEHGQLADSSITTAAGRDGLLSPRDMRREPSHDCQTSRFVLPQNGSFGGTALARRGDNPSEWQNGIRQGQHDLIPESTWLPKSSESIWARPIRSWRSWKVAIRSSSPTPKAVGPRRRWWHSPRTASGWSARSPSARRSPTPSRPSSRSSASWDGALSEVAEEIKRVPYKVVEGPNGMAAVEIAGQAVHARPRSPR